MLHVFHQGMHHFNLGQPICWVCASNCCAPIYNRRFTALSRSRVHACLKRTPLLRHIDDYFWCLFLLVCDRSLSPITSLFGNSEDENAHPPFRMFTLANVVPILAGAARLTMHVFRPYVIAVLSILALSSMG